MDGYTRYAIYAAPPPGRLATLGAAWLGWDPETGRADAHAANRSWPALPIERRLLTERPRKYGLHGTLKPPFRVAEGSGVAALHAAVTALAPRLPRVSLPALEVRAIGPFLALVPVGDTSGLAALAATLVEALDGFRDPPDAAELSRRRAAGLSPRQDELLQRWGYPYVMDEFRFHITLTGPIPDDADKAATAAAIAPLFEEAAGTPFRIDDVCLFGEGQDGRFRNLHRYPLTG